MNKWTGWEGGGMSKRFKCKSNYWLRKEIARLKAEPNGRYRYCLYRDILWARQHNKRR